MIHASRTQDRHRFTRRLARAAALCLAMQALATGTARADIDAAKRAAAQALFDEARRLVGEGNHTQACPKFRESQELDPGIGTLYNLADCHEATGKTASAWAAFRETADMARVAGQSDRERAARERADALEPRLMRLAIDVASEARAPGLEVRRDDVPVGQGQWGVPVPVDPGKHTITASAPNRKTRVLEVMLSKKGETATLRIAALEEVAAPEPAPPATPALTPDPGSPAPSSAPRPVTAEAQGGDDARSWAFVLGGVGVVGVTVGSFVAMSAKSKYDDSLDHCDPNDPNRCSEEGVSLRNSARSRGNFATVAMGLGAAALAGGAVLWFTAPDDPVQSGRLGAGATVAGDGASVMMRGTW